MTYNVFGGTLNPAQSIQNPGKPELASSLWFLLPLAAEENL